MKSRTMLGVLLSLAVVALLGGLCAFRASRLRSFQVHPAAVRLLPLNPDRIAERLAGALRFRTVSHANLAEDDPREFEGIQSYLERSYPKMYAALLREKIGERGQLLTWKGSDPALLPVLLLAHLDVVPVEDASLKDWTHPPFAGEIADGYVWGRGAHDDKGSVILLHEAVEHLVASGFRPRRTVMLALGSDEEVGGLHGARKIAAALEGRAVRAEFALDEGGAIVDGMLSGSERPVAALARGEKGYVTLELSVEAKGGHSSVPPRNTAIGILAEAITRLEAEPMPAVLDDVTGRALSYIAPEVSFFHRFLLANLWLFRPVVVHRMAREPALDAALRTTTAVTVVQGGIKENVLPVRATALVNFRIRPGDSLSNVREHVQTTVLDSRVRIRELDLAVSEPLSSTDATDEFRFAQRVISEVFPEAIVAPTIANGATDSRHYARISSNLFRFAPLRLRKGELDRIHGNDERYPVDQLVRGATFYARLIEESASK